MVRTMLKRVTLGFLILCAVLLSYQCALADGGPGLFIRNGTSSITTPVANKTYVLDTSDQTLKVYNGASWVSISVIPASAGGSNLGSSSNPWGSLYIGNAATNNTQITGTTTAARVLTLPDANSNSVVPSSAVADQFLTGIGSTGVITRAQPSFSNISGVATSGQIPNNTAYIDVGNSWSTHQVPSVAGTVNLGSVSLPWQFMYVGGAATNNTKIQSTTLTAARIFTLPDADSNSVIPDTGASDNFLTGITSGGVITKAQPSFSNISGSATTAQLPVNQTQLTTANNLTSATSLASIGTVTTGTWSATVIDLTKGGTGATTASGARSNLSAAILGANNDITSMSALTGSITSVLGSDTYGLSIKASGSQTQPLLQLKNNADSIVFSLDKDGKVTAGVWNGSVITSTYLPSNTAYTDSTNSWSANQVPNSAGARSLGTTALPWLDLFVGGSATNNNRIVSASTTAARTFTLPDANSNPVQPDTGAANNFLTGITSGGVITKAQPSFSNISGTASLTTQVTGTLPLANGGLGATTPLGGRTTLELNSYTSPDQTITSGGQLILAHGLGRTPIFVDVLLVNVTAEAGYTAGQVVKSLCVLSNNQGFSAILDSTNLTIRFGSGATVFSINNATTGAATTITNANWNARFISR